MATSFIKRSVKVGTIILVAFLVIVVVLIGPFGSIHVETQLVYANPPLIRMVLNGETDTTIENAVNRSGKQVDQIIGLDGTLLNAAVENHRMILAKWLLETKHANANGRGGSVPLSEAIRQNDVVMVRLLLNNGANPMNDSTGITPMWVAENSPTEPDIMAMLQKWKPTRPAATQKAKP